MVNIKAPILAEAPNKIVNPENGSNTANGVQNVNRPNIAITMIISSIVSLVVVFIF